MNIHKKKVILFVSLIALFVLLALLTSALTKEIAISIIIPLFIIWFILYEIWWRCPHCKKHLGDLEHGVNNCKYCGGKLSDD